MKTRLLLFALVIASTPAFAQGKITIGNDSLHPIVDYYGPVSQAGGYSGLTMQLMGGTSIGSMTLQTTIVGDAIGNAAFPDGRINNRTFILTGVPVASTAFLQLLFFDTATGGRLRYGQTPVFTVTTGSFAYNSIVLHTAPGNSTWADGPVLLVFPEPSTGALLAIGVVAMFWRRVRKRSHHERHQTLTT